MDKITNDFLSFKGALSQIVQGIVKNPVEVEDIVHEAYTRSFEAGKNQQIKSPKAFLARTARNLALNYIELSSVKLNVSADDDAFSSAYSCSKEPDVVDHVIAQEHFFHFCKAVESLPPQCRLVFILKQVYGMSQKEIGKQLNISENTVEFHVGKGLFKCRNYLQSVYVESGYTEGLEKYSGGKTLKAKVGG